MKTRYVSIAAQPTRMDWWDDARAGDSLAKTVFEPETKPNDTGLVGPDGVKLYRVEERDPIGFIRSAKDKA